MDYRILEKKYRDEKIPKMSKKGILFLLVLLTPWIFYVVLALPFYPIGFIFFCFDYVLIFSAFWHYCGIRTQITISEQDLSSTNAPPQENSVAEPASLEEFLSQVEENSPSENSSVESDARLSTPPQSTSSPRQYTIVMKGAGSEKPKAKVYGKYDPEKNKEELITTGCIVVILGILGFFAAFCLFLVCLS